MGTYWADVSQYQRPVDDSYPHRIFCFRSNTGDRLDTAAAANLTWALSALERGRLDTVIVYYFFRPGQANCDLWREVVTRNNKIDPRIVCMVDVEGDNGTVRGDCSAEINDEVRRVQGWLGGKRVIGYLNPKSDPGLWLTRPGIPLIIPHYNNDPGNSYAFPDRFAHQYSDRVQCAPFGPCDANFSALSIPDLKQLFGVGESMSDVKAINDFTAAFNGPIGSDVKDIRQQLTGGRDHGEYPGWAQLGDRTLVDAVAAIGAKLGIEGFVDVKSGK